MNEAGQTGAARDADKMKKGDSAELAEAKMANNRWVPVWMCSPDAQNAISNAQSSPVASEMTSSDVSFAVGDYSPKERGGASKTDYIAALDRLIETRGRSCPLPLSDSTVGQYFPEEHYRLSERINRQWKLQFTRVDKIEAKQRQQKRRRDQTQVAQAQIELAFTTPTELAAWYKRQERQGIYDDDLIDAVYAWSQRFSGVRSDAFASGESLWAVLKDMHDALTSRTAVDKWLDTLVLPKIK